jgi:hypothetical protein
VRPWEDKGVHYFKVALVVENEKRAEDAPRAEFELWGICGVRSMTSGR